MKFINNLLFGGDNKENEDPNKKKLTQENDRKISSSSVFLAIKNGQNLEQTLAEYIEQGNDVNQPYNKFGKTFLHYAVENGNYEAIQTLIKHGAISRSSPALGHPTHVAIRKDDPRAVEIIFAAYLDGKIGEERASKAKELSEAIDPQTGLQAGMAAIFNGNSEIIEKISQFSPITQQYTYGSKVYSAADIATQGPSPISYYQFIEKDPSFHIIKTEDELGRNCLDYAIQNNKKEAVEYLLNHTQSVDYPEKTFASIANGLTNDNQELASILNEKKAFFESKLSQNENKIENDSHFKTSLDNIHITPMDNIDNSIETNSLQKEEDDVPKFPKLEVREFTPEELGSQREELIAKKRAFLTVAREDVVNFVDEERNKKIKEIKNQKDKVPENMSFKDKIQKFNKSSSQNR